MTWVRGRSDPITSAAVESDTIRIVESEPLIHGRSLALSAASQSPHHRSPEWDTVRVEKRC